MTLAMYGFETVYYLYIVHGCDLQDKGTVFQWYVPGSHTRLRMLKGEHVMLKARICNPMLTIAAGNQQTISLTLTWFVKSIVNCFCHYRISNKAVVTLNISEPLQSLVIISELCKLPPCLTISCLIIFLPPSSCTVLHK